MWWVELVYTSCAALFRGYFIGNVQTQPLSCPFSLTLIIEQTVNKRNAVGISLLTASFYYFYRQLAIRSTVGLKLKQRLHASKLALHRANWKTRFWLSRKAKVCRSANSAFCRKQIKNTPLNENIENCDVIFSKSEGFKKDRSDSSEDFPDCVENSRISSEEQHIGPSKIHKITQTEKIKRKRALAGGEVVKVTRKTRSGRVYAFEM